MGLIALDQQTENVPKISSVLAVQDRIGAGM